MKKILSLLFLLASFASYGQTSTFGGIGLRVNDTTTYQTNAAALHTAGYYDIYFNNQATNDHWDVWNGSSYDHIFAFGQGSGSSVWGGITGTLSNQTDLQTALDAKIAISDSYTTLTDGSTVTITGPMHNLTSDESTITWTFSHGTHFQNTDIVLNATTTTWTFPANTLCVVDGVPSGDNTAAMVGVSGDNYAMSIKKNGSTYKVVIKNFGQ